MEFKFKARKNPNIELYDPNDYNIAVKFAKKAYKEFGTFIRAIVLFGAAARKQKAQDIDILVIVDDVRISITKEIVETYRIITEKIVLDTSSRLHITTLKFTTFWDMIRAADPIAINILRDGVAIIDTGFFDPIQLLLFQGRIRPSAESVFNYYYRAPKGLFFAKTRILQSFIDMYWAVTDASHALLMSFGYVPPTPGHIKDMLDRFLIPKKVITKNDSRFVSNIYEIMKKITHNKLKEVSLEEWHKYYINSKKYVDKVKAIIDQRMKSFITQKHRI